ALRKLPLRQAGCNATFNEQDGELAKRVDLLRLDPPGLERLIAVELLAEDVKLALKRVDHRLVYAGIHAGARLATTRSCDRLLELRGLRLRDAVLPLIGDHGKSLGSTARMPLGSPVSLSR